jgi:hypothetical protein
MKRFLAIIAWTSISFFIGFAVGRATARKNQEALTSQQQLYAVGVDCYDKDGNLVHSMGEKYGGVTVGCAPGQFARLKQPNPPIHIEVH